MLEITSKSISPDYVPELSHDGGCYEFPSYVLDGCIMGVKAHVTIDDMSHGDIDSNYEIVADIAGKEYFYSFQQFPPAYVTEEDSNFPQGIADAVGKEFSRLGLSKYAPSPENDV